VIAGEDGKEVEEQFRRKQKTWPSSLYSAKAEREVESGDLPWYVR
jgi:hypothetical protein